MLHHPAARHARATPRRARVALLLAAAAVVPVRAGAQGGSGAVILELPASARAVAMGDAGGALADVASLPYNPVAIVAVRRAAGGLAVERTLGGATLAAATGAVRLGPGVLGASVLSLAYPEAAEIVASPDGGAGIETGARVDAHDLVAGVAWAMRRGRLQGGATAKWVAQYLPGASGGALAADVGVAADLGNVGGVDLRLAAAAQHLGGPIETLGREAPLPRTMRVGAQLARERMMGARWTTVMEATQVRGGTLRPRAGLEGVWVAGGTAIAARAGAVSRAGAEREGRVSLGGGVGRGPLALDYAWRRFGALGSTHRFGVRWQP